ncbi:MAG: tail fiber domain-containing protein [Proteobacteria bacterium]|nr:tail fiber domain-containing protein [Pseudomonadota bacterium]
MISRQCFTDLAAGNVGIGITNPSQKLSVGASGDGSVAIANSWTTYSDQRLKKNVSVIDSALEKISKLSGYFFQWKKGSDKSRQIGVMAQEVEKIFPELVKQGADGIKSVDYPKLAVPMLEAIKSLKGQVDQLKDENAVFKSENTILKSENEVMKAYLCDKDPSAPFCERIHE